MRVKTFKAKPVVIKAVQWTGDNLMEIVQFCEGNFFFSSCFDTPTIVTLEGTMRASLGDWIIKGLKGEFYPCKPDVFAEKYEEVSSEGSNA
jgi:hypothetical protein